MNHYPILDEREIVHVLCEKDVAYENIFVEPMDSSKVIAAYKYIVGEIVQEIIIEEESTDGFNTALHKQSFHDVAFLKILLDLMRAAQVTDFSSRDLNFPVPQRTKRNLSALINLMYFVTNLREEYLTLTEPVETLMRERQQQTKETNATIKQYNELLLKYNQETVQREQVRREIEKQKETSTELNKKYVHLTEECQRKNIHFNDMERTKVALKEKIQQFTNANEQLKKKIILSPVKKIEEIQQMKKLLNTLSFENSELECAVQDIQQQLKLFIKEETNLKKYNSLLNENLNVADEIRTTENQILTIRKDYSQLQQEIKMKKDMQEKLRNSISEIKNSMDNKENSLHLLEKKERWNAVKRSAKEKEAADNQKRQRIQEMKATQHRLMQKKEDLLKQQEETTQSTQNMEKQLDTALETYKNKFFTIIAEELSDGINMDGESQDVNMDG